MKLFKKAASVFLALCLVVVCLPIPAQAAAEVASGTCGADGGNLTWVLTDDGTLTISGTGAMEDYLWHSDMPWYSYRENITRVVVDAGVTSIGYAAFSGCSSLSSITVAPGNPVYHSAGNCLIHTESKTLVSGCKASTIPTDGSVTTIGDAAFDGCSSLESITIPKGVTSIGYAAFSWCSSLSSITIPESVTTIGKYAFEDCSSLTSITIPEGVTSIGYAAFSWCSSLSSITLPESVTSISDSAFWGCSSLSSITIPEGVTTIGDSAFEGCSSLSSITIPASVTWIGYWAFCGCSSLTSITIPASVTWIGEHAFTCCDNLISITVAPENPVFHSDGNCLIATEAKTLVLGCKASTIPADGSVTSIGIKAFYGCSNLSSITIPEGVTAIGEDAFWECSSLSRITFTGDAPSICDFAFLGVTATAYYPADNATWTEIVRRNYDGDITWLPYSSTGVTVSGTVTSFGGDSEDITIQLIKSGKTEAAYTVTVQGKSAAYTIENVEAGSYTLRVSKTMHAAREYTVTVGASDVTQNAEIWLYGDVTCDGLVNAADATQVCRMFSGKASVFDGGDSETQAYRLLVADVYADNSVNATDATQIKRYFSGKPSVFTNFA